MRYQKKILILTEWFPPGYKAGGPIQSCVNICSALKNSYEIYVLTTDTDHGSNLPYKSIIPGKWQSNEQLGVNVFYLQKKQSRGFSILKEQIMQIKPEFLYLNIFFSPLFVLYPLWLKYSGTIQGKVILSPRGTLYKSAVSEKGYKKKPFLKLVNRLGIQKHITFHATNSREAGAINDYFPGSTIVIANNLPKTLQTPFTTCIKNVGQLNLIFIARVVPIKNLLFVLNVLSSVTASVLLTIVGPIEDKDYWRECVTVIANLPVNIQVVMEGPKPPGELNNLLQRHHVFILPTAGENFGHAIFEALVAGRPVLISDQTPWLDIRENSAGWALPLERDLFLEVINDVSGYNQQEYNQLALGSWNYANRFIQNPALLAPYKDLFS